MSHFVLDRLDSFLESTSPTMQIQAPSIAPFLQLLLHLNQLASNPDLHRNTPQKRAQRSLGQSSSTSSTRGVRSRLRTPESVVGFEVVGAEGVVVDEVEGVVGLEDFFFFFS